MASRCPTPRRTFRHWAAHRIPVAHRRQSQCGRCTAPIRRGLDRRCRTRPRARVPMNSRPPGRSRAAGIERRSLPCRLPDSPCSRACRAPSPPPASRGRSRCGSAYPRPSRPSSAATPPPTRRHPGLRMPSRGRSTRPERQPASAHMPCRPRAASASVSVPSVSPRALALEARVAPTTPSTRSQRSHCQILAEPS